MSSSPPTITDYTFPDRALIGEGAYGWVWLGLYKGDQPRAIKVFKPRALQDELWRGEYEKLRALDEPPGVVTLYDAGRTDEGLPFVAMRLMADRSDGGSEWQGRTLSRRLALDPPKMSEGWRLLLEVAETLAFLHRNGVRHCDLKPGNILLSGGEEARPVLCDFGQSRRKQDNAGVAAAPGTVLYACPEQLRHPEQAKKSWDVYSFGVTAWQVLTGELPRLQSLISGGDDGGPVGAPSDLDRTLVSQRRYDSSLFSSTSQPLPSPGELAERIESEAAKGSPPRPSLVGRGCRVDRRFQHHRALPAGRWRAAFAIPGHGGGGGRCRGGPTTARTRG